MACHAMAQETNHLKPLYHLLKTSLILVVEKVGAERARAPPTLKAEGQSTPKIMDGDVMYMVKIL